jgi:hypothetical protein
VKLKYYKDFLLESILYTSKEFSDILKNMTDDDIAVKLLSLINKDIKTYYNMLNTTDKNDTLSFVSDRQSNTKLKSGSTLDDLFKITSNKTGVGRICKSILSDNGILVKDKDLEEFVNKFKAAYDKKNSKDESIRIVRGEEIRKRYLYNGYCSETMGGKGTLGKSCMRYEETQEFLDIYVENPEVCGLLIKVDDDDKLVARALLWKTNNGLYLDRIYYTLDSDKVLLYNWVSENFQEIKNIFDLKNDELESFDRGYERFEVKLKDSIDYRYYPYMDSLAYYYKKTHTLYNYIPSDVEKKYLYYLQGTDGYGERQDSVYCEYEDAYYPEEDTVYSSYQHINIPEGNAVFSEYLDSYLHSERSVYSKLVSSHIDGEDSYIVYLNPSCSENDYYPSDMMDNCHIDEFSGNYFIDDLLVKNGNAYYLKESIIKVYKVSEDSEKRYKEVYNSIAYVSTEYDKDLFGFDLLECDRIFSKKSYYTDVYANVVYQDFINLLSSLKDVPEDKLNLKIKEVNDADEYLKSRNDFYVYNNLFHEKFNDEEELMDWYKTKFDEVFETSFTAIRRSYYEWTYMQDFKDLIKKYCSEYPFNFTRYSHYRSSELLDDIKNELEDAFGSFRYQSSYLSDFVSTCRHIIGTALSYIKRMHGVEGEIVEYYLNNRNKFKP